MKILKAIWAKPIPRFALITLLLFYLLAIFADFVAPYDINHQQIEYAFHKPSKLSWHNGLAYCTYGKNVNKYVLKNKSNIKWLKKSKPYKLLGIIKMNRKLFGDNDNYPLFLLGSDALGRDIFSRLLYGSRVSLSIGLLGIFVTLILGFFIGGISGYFGGKLDLLIMSLIDFIVAIPTLYLLIGLSAILNLKFSSANSYILIILLLSMFGWALPARTIRGMVASLRKQTFILSAEALGQSKMKILIKHFLPNLSSYILVVATLSIPSYILGEAALSFLGLGIQEPSTSWGLMLKQTQTDLKVFMLSFWWMLSPGFAIVISVICFNILGDALRDAVDPKMHLE